MAPRKFFFFIGLLCVPFVAQAADAPTPSPVETIVQNFMAEKNAMEGSVAAMLRSEQHLDEITRALVMQYAADRAKWEQERQGYEARLQTAMEWLKAAQAKETK